MSIISVINDIILLTLYIQSLHVYNKYWCRLDNNKQLNPIQHEQLIVITRYCVIFGISVLIDFIQYLIRLFSYIVIFNFYDDLYDLFTALSHLLLLMNGLSHIVALYSSFEWGYKHYIQLPSHFKQRKENIQQY